MNCFSEEQSNRISHLVREIEKLSDVERLFLYLQLPCGRADASDGIQKSLDLFSKKPDQETTQTYTWILSHLEIDPNVSLPKQEVYDEYRAYCQANRFEPLCVADFGKAMKHAFPCIKPRRLGQRGNSRYCYSGLRKRYKIQAPDLPEMGGEQVVYCANIDCNQTSTATNTNTNNFTSNHNNMTVKSNLEFPLSKRPNCTRPEVMNLKTELNTTHHHHQEPQQQQQQQTNNQNGAIFSEEEHSDNKQQACSFQLEDISCNPRAHPNQSIAHHHPEPASAGSSYDGHGTSLNQVNQQNRFNDYDPELAMEQPGTPDDDEYRHNYQDLLQMGNHFLKTKHVHNGLGPIQTSAASGPFVYTPAKSFHEVGPIVNDQNNVRMTPHTSNVSNDGNQITNIIQSQPPLGAHNSNTLMPILTGNGVGDHISVRPPVNPLGVSHIQLINTTNHHQQQQQQQLQPHHHHQQQQQQQQHHNHSGGNRVEACASPFLSPASTPYPSLAVNYSTQDIMQEYCTSGCRLYQSS